MRFQPARVLQRGYPVARKLGEADPASEQGPCNRGVRVCIAALCHELCYGGFEGGLRSKAPEHRAEALDRVPDRVRLVERQLAERGPSQQRLLGGQCARNSLLRDR